VYPNLSAAFSISAGSYATHYGITLPILSKLVFMIPILAALLVRSAPPFTLTLILAIPPLPVPP